MAKLKKALAEYYHTDRLQLNPISGGDINLAFLLEVDNRRLFIKANHSPNSLGILQSEFDSLEYFRTEAKVRVPSCEPPQSFSGGHWLSMNYISSGRPNSQSWESLAEQLVQLHQVTQPTFGWPTANFIGSLPQENAAHTQWNQFYIQQRLVPQIEMSRNLGYFAAEDSTWINKFLREVEQLIPEIEPSLLHGDFWSGNYHWDESGLPYLIDPSAYYGHREVDLAMASLFGGFSTIFFHHYQHLWPLDSGHQDRLQLYQLYYILVHLNLFGPSYLGQVRQIMQKFSGKK